MDTAKIHNQLIVDENPYIIITSELEIKSIHHFKFPYHFHGEGEVMTCIVGMACIGPFVSETFSIKGKKFLIVKIINPVSQMSENQMGVDNHINE